MCSGAYHVGFSGTKSVLAYDVGLKLTIGRQLTRTCRWSRKSCWLYVHGAIIWH